MNALLKHTCGYEASLDEFCPCGTMEDAMTCNGCGEVFRVVRTPKGEPRNRIEVIRPSTKRTERNPNANQ